MKQLASFIAVLFCFGWQVACGTDGKVPQGGTMELRPGVAIDRGENLLFIMAPGGLVEAVNITDGEVIWQSREVAKPLWYFDGLLLCQIETSEAGKLLLALLDVHQRGEIVANFRAELPEDVYATIDSDPNRTFIARAAEEGGDIFINWEQRTEPMSGRWDPSDEPSTTIRTGRFRFDRKAQTWRQFSSKQRIAALEVQPRDLSERERIPGIRATQFRSSDDYNALVSQRVANNRVWDRYEWTILDRASGNQIGKFNNFQAQAPFVVIDSLLVFESAPHRRRVNDEMISEPLKLRAIDLRTGDEKWNRLIRDTNYRGSLPP